MKYFHFLILSALSGLLLSISWVPHGFPLLLFVSFIPLLLIEDYINKNKQQYHRFYIFRYAYLSFFIWNLITTYWVYNASFFGVSMAIVFNSLFMAIVFTLFHITRRVSNTKAGYLAFICYWLSFEFLHLDWDLTWSWLNLGNGFAAYPIFYQWYEFTGTFGGSLWVLLANLFGFWFVKSVILKTDRRKNVIYKGVYFGLLIVVPIIISIYIYFNYQEQKNPVNITVIQPNIDPWNEKFSGMPVSEQLDKMLKLAKEKTSEKTQYIVGPETALPEELWENELASSENIDSLLKFIRKYPNLKVVIGLTTRKLYERGEQISATARKLGDNGLFYDYYNAAIFVDKEEKFQLYHKSKLVPGVEKMPFSKLLKPLEKFAIDLGGSTGSMGTQKDRTAFADTASNIKIAPVICYESIYGEFVSKYVANGANLIFILTNDGWWGDTPGYKQHFYYARLRAVETRRGVARSANTGISCFINQRGDVVKKTNWWEPTAINEDLNLNSKITFYVDNGDYIGRIASYICLLLMLYTIANPFVKTKKL